MEHFTAKRPIVLEAQTNGDNETGDQEDDEIVSQIKELLYTRVRPAVAQDGGDIVFEDFTDGIVTLQMRGACAGCPSSSATLKMGWKIYFGTTSRSKRGKTIRDLLIL